ncbi:MAG: DinB family protein [Chloroflexota bacterium]|jgi:uncharacterized damage-inducible protein DinB|nr:MAG: DinB family protein [Chloroflexota bacterium]UCF28605.1 MAG: DinB family protein [Chloroflexota bacterium]
MAGSNKAQLINSLTESHSKLLEIVRGYELETVVYQAPIWQIRDILWHIAVWDRQVTKSIIAFIDDDEYSINNFEEDQFNQEAFLEGRKLTGEKLLEECDAARQEFKIAVQDFPVDKFPSEFLYPWGDERGDIATLVDYMVEHDEEHRDEIYDVISSG